MTLAISAWGLGKDSILTLALFFVLRAHPVVLRITPTGAVGIYIGVSGDLILVSHMQGEHPNRCTMTLASSIGILRTSH